MKRNNTFNPLREPLRSHSSLELQNEHTTGPFSFLNPTRAHYRHSELSKLNSSPSSLSSTSSTSSSTPADATTTTTVDGAAGNGQNETYRKGKEDEEDEDQPASDIQYQWRSRDNRKGRHALIVTPAPFDDANAPYLAPHKTSTLRATAQGIKRMLTQYPYWDVSWLVAIIFTLGSVVWVINAFFVWLPLVDPATEFPTEIGVGGGWTAFIGATIFEIGSILLMLEAVNENRAGCFGWALERVLEGDNEEKGEGGKWRVKASVDVCEHHHTNKKNFVGKGDVPSDQKSNATNTTEKPSTEATTSQSTEKTWQWFPSAYDLRTHYFHELGFLACLAQLFGASIFWISGFTALPAINTALIDRSQGALDGAYWAPQIIGGTGFIVSGILFMLETQKKWYLPAPTVLGWHIGLWNLIGAFGFTLCGALGPAYGNTGAQYEASLATFWGSWAFLIGSVIQWYECLDTHPVEETKGEKTMAAATPKSSS
ncbi:hypothetical protein MMC25_001061 [Agyrium rufum]|nr:hypothetical protein [Agyrium rufum]